MANFPPSAGATVASSLAASNGLRLPAEIILMTAKLLSSTEDLMALRLVCKATNVHAIPLLFDRINLSVSTKSFRNAREIIKEYPTHVKAIHICPLTYGMYFWRSAVLSVLFCDL